MLSMTWVAPIPNKQPCVTVVSNVKQENLKMLSGLWLAIVPVMVSEFLKRSSSKPMPLDADHRLHW